MQTTEVKKNVQEIPPSVKKDYEAAVDAFLLAEKTWKDSEEYVSSGKFMADVLVNANGNPSKAMSEWTSIWNDLRTKQEDYNAKRKSAADALRQAVVLTPNQWRGPDGDPTMFSYGSFKVSSVTKRGFDSEALFTLIRKHNLLDRLLSLKMVNKEGKEVPLVKQEWDIDYDGVMNWLRASKLDDVITGAYDEKESTPQVKGPKEIAFLGDKKKD
jgi:hypothetical protein